MDLLETILRNAEVEDFQETFKKNKIDSSCLKLLNENDLQLLGIESEDKRKQFLKIINNLQIPIEKKINIQGDKAYALLVLNNISFHLQKQFANLTYILKREDVDICDVQLTPAVIALQNVLTSTQTSLNIFEHKVLKLPKKKNRKKYLIASLIVTLSTVFICTRYLLKAP